MSIPWFIMLLASHLTLLILRNLIDKNGDHLNTYWHRNYTLVICMCHANVFCCYYKCCFWFDYKASVPPSRAMPALFFKALVGRRHCAPSEQIILTTSTHFENIPWALSNLKSDSQLEVWELHGQFIRLLPTSLKAPNEHVTGSIPHRGKSKTDNRFRKINDRFLRQICFPYQLALPETIWRQLW